MGEQEQGHRTDRKEVILGRLVRGVTIVGGSFVVVGLVLALVGSLSATRRGSSGWQRARRGHLTLDLVGWLTGLEPVTFGATIRCSAD
jgi:hypothetical protein